MGSGRDIGLAIAGLGALYLLTRQQPTEHRLGLSGGGGTRVVERIVQAAPATVAAGGDAGGIPPPVIQAPTFTAPIFEAPVITLPPVILNTITNILPPAIPAATMDSGGTPDDPVVVVEVVKKAITAFVSEPVELEAEGSGYSAFQLKHLVDKVKPLVTIPVELEAEGGGYGAVVAKVKNFVTVPVELEAEGGGYGAVAAKVKDAVAAFVTLPVELEAEGIGGYIGAAKDKIQAVTDELNPVIRVQNAIGDFFFESGSGVLNPPLPYGPLRNIWNWAIDSLEG